MHHITDIPQIDGSTRRLYAASPADAELAREIIRERGGHSALDHWPDLVARTETIEASA